MSAEPRQRPRLVARSTRDWTPEDEAWNEVAVTWQVEALPAVRASAERWTAGISTLLGGAGVGMLLAGPGRFADLQSPYEAVSKALFFTAAGAALLALACAIVASTATSRTLFLLSGSALRHASRRALRKATRTMTVSRVATWLALILLLASAALLFFAPTTSTPAPATTSRARQAAP